MIGVLTVRNEDFQWLGAEIWQKFLRSFLSTSPETFCGDSSLSAWGKR